jgi:signal transduction histidine kinase
MAIRAKLVIIFFGFAILPMFLLTLRWHGTAKESVTSLLRQRIDYRAQEIANQITAALNQHRAEVAALAQRPPLKAYARSLAQNAQALPEAQLRMDLGAFLLAHQKQYAALVCANRGGAPLFKIESSAGPGGALRAYFEDKEFSGDDTSHFAAAFAIANPEGEVVIVAEAGEVADGPRLHLVTPLRDETGQAVAALIVKLRAAPLITEAVGPRAAPVTDPASPGQAGAREVIILNRQGRVLYAADQAKQGKFFAEAFRPLGPTLTAIRGGVRNDKDIYRIPAYGNDWMIRLSETADSPQLAVFVLENYSDAVSGLEWAGVIMILLTLVLAMVAVLLLYYFISGTTDSIQRVTRGAKAITAGQLDAPIQVKTNDETRVLADAFNRMAARLREMVAKESERRQFESFARLSAVLTHDLKNQILSLSLLVANMERKFDREGFREDAMHTLSESVENLQNIVARLSDPLGQSRGARQREDLNLIVERVLQRTAEQASERYQIAATLLPRLTALVDAKAIERVVENLVINALEAMPEGGTLRISTRIENGSPVITVADSGKGMPEEFIRDRLFRPFATTKKKGIGLGLYSCRDIIEQHGGRIEVTSKVDAGTEFRIVLPPAPDGDSVKVREEQTAAV